MLQLYYPFGGQIQTRATRETHQLTTKLERQNFIVILEMELVVIYNKMEGCWFYRRTYITQPFNFSKFPWKYAIFATSFPLCRSKFGFCTKICRKLYLLMKLMWILLKNSWHVDFLMNGKKCYLTQIKIFRSIRDILFLLGASYGHGLRLSMNFFF